MHFTKDSKLFAEFDLHKSVYEIAAYRFNTVSLCRAIVSL